MSKKNICFEQTVIHFWKQVAPCNTVFIAQVIQFRILIKLLRILLKILEIRLTISRHVDCLFWELGTLVSIQFKLWDWQGPDLPQTSASFGSLEGRGCTVERSLRPVVRSVAVAHRLLQLNSDYQPFNCQHSHSKSSAYLIS